MTSDESQARQAAAAVGLEKLDGKHLGQFAQSMASTRELAAMLPRDLHWSEEMAVVLRLPNARTTKP